MFKLFTIIYQYVSRTNDINDKKNEVLLCEFVKYKFDGIIACFFLKHCN